MEDIKRESYLKQLIEHQNNGMVKVITGIRRCGKSYLLDPIFKTYLLDNGIPEDHIIKVELDRIENKRFHRDPSAFNQYLRMQMKDNGMYYLLLDEIQLVDDFEAILNGFLYERNVDVYVTGSNSKFLSSDVITEFRGRGDQIHLFPLSFSEFMEVYSGDKYDGLTEYMTYGGMPYVVSLKTDQDKSEYLKQLFEMTYFRDIVEKNEIKRIDVLDSITNLLASSVGSLTNTQRVYNTFVSSGRKEVSINTISSYISFLEDAYLVKKAERYDVKGRKYIHTPSKYYFADVGLRNARLNFRQQEETHIMENILYNELLGRGFNVDVGVVEIRENGKRIQTEVDFVCNKGSQRYYIQSALRLETKEKTDQESRPYLNIQDSFKKIIIVRDHIKPWYTENGILVMDIYDFLLNADSLDK